ncbi:MAG: amidase family protein [Myxococcota bacterium]
MAIPIHALSAVELRQKLDAGELSSVEIVKALHARADEVEPKVNAFAHQLRRTALKRAGECDDARRRGDELGPLHGVPLTIKESLDTVGIASTLGMRSRLGSPATRDSVVAQVVKEAGAIVVGKTNVPQTLLAPLESTNELFGTTNNPWSLNHAPGGSSGGEGAAVAAGLSPMGIGTDIGGSVRAPAALCGVLGLKPTGDRWSNLGAASAINGQEFIRTQTGPFARTTADLTLLMQVLNCRRQSELDPRVPPMAFDDPAEVDVTSLRVGFFEDDGFFTPAASVRRAVREAVALLEESGIEVVRYAPPNVEAIAFNYLRGISADGLATLDAALGDEALIQPLRTMGRLARMPRRARAGLAKALRLMGEERVPEMLNSLGEKDVATFWARTAERNQHRIDEHRAWQRDGLDALLTPTMITPAVPHGQSHDFTLSFVNMARYNYLDRPAGVVPITRVRPDEIRRTGLRDRLEKRAAAIENESVGLPVGVQLVGRPWEESRLLALMAHLEGLASKGELFPRTPVDP